MNLKDVIREIENGKSKEDLTKKRFACAHCGTTWTELVGLIQVHNGGNEDLYLRIGMEPEACQMCRLQARECQKCGSREVYEINFSKEVTEQTPLNFKNIRIVRK
jgi:hypothetical protein